MNLQAVLDVQHPELLWAAAMLTLVSLLVSRRPTWMAWLPRVREHRLIWAASLLILVGLSEPAIVNSGKHAAVVFLVDRSDSIAATQVDASLSFIRSSLVKKETADLCALVVFAEQAFIESPLGGELRAQNLESSPDRGGTNIEKGLQLATALLEGIPGGRIVLISDGLETEGVGRRAALSAAAQGVRADVLPIVRGESAATVRITRLFVPENARPRERFQICVLAAGPPGSPLTSTLAREGEVVASKNGAFSSEGDCLTCFSESLDRAGIFEYSAEVSSHGKSESHRDEQNLLVTVSGPPQVLLVSSIRQPALDSILESGGYEVERAPIPPSFQTSDDLKRFDAVLLDEVPASGLSRIQMNALREFVQSRGAGLVMSGGLNSFGPGGYAFTPVEEVLPVFMRVKMRLNAPAFALVLLVDKSGSMEAREEDRRKMDIAREATLSLTDFLDPEDALAVLAFDRQVHVVQELRPVRHSERLAEQLALLEAGGGTSISPALEQAWRLLEDSRADRKHILLLSDGRDSSPDLEALLSHATSESPVVSVVCIGQDADRDLLRRLATAYRGRFYEPGSLTELPEVFLREASLGSGRSVVESRTPITMQRSHPILVGIREDSLPSLDGHIATTAKPASEVLLNAGDQDPLLVIGRAGLGKTAVLATDLHASWTRELWHWSDFARLWIQLLRWTSRTAAAEGLEADFQQSRRSGTLVLDAWDRDGRLEEFLDVTAEVLGPAETVEKFVLSQVAPGRYAGRFSIGAPGFYRVAVNAAGGPGGATRSAQFGHYFGADSEFRGKTDLRGLEEIANLAGGSVLNGSEDLFSHREAPGRHRALRDWVLLCALTLLSLDLLRTE